MNNDLISRSTAIATAVNAAIEWHKLANPQYSIAYCIGEAVRGIKTTQPEIIRCKECKYRGETEDGEYNPEDIVCAYWMSDGLSETDYCSYAERRTEDDFCSYAERRNDE